MAAALQSRGSEAFAVDIHPGAHFGAGILLDHGTGAGATGAASAASLPVLERAGVALTRAAAAHLRCNWQDRRGVPPAGHAALRRGQVPAPLPAGVVIGETVVLGNGVSIMHGVTLGGERAAAAGLPLVLTGRTAGRTTLSCGPCPHTCCTPYLATTLAGTGKEDGDRHPKVSDNVLVGACARILGNIHVGTGAQAGVRRSPGAVHCTAPQTTKLLLWQRQPRPWRVC